jgi:hypothetical protein
MPKMRFHASEATVTVGLALLLLGLLDYVRRGVFALDARDGDVFDAERVSTQPFEAPVHGVLKVGEHRERLMGAVRDDGKAA